jgi:hypothetical protein
MGVEVEVRVEVKVKIETEIEIEKEQLTIGHSNFLHHRDSTCHPEPRVFQRGEGSDRADRD